MRKIAVVGTGYVGLVTGVALSEIGHHVTCIDVDLDKVKRMQAGISPIYEPGLDELMQKNIAAGRLHFTNEHELGFHEAEVIYIAVGTPQREDGSADLQYVEQAALDIATHAKRDVIVVTKSTVPVGTNERIRDLIRTHRKRDIQVEVVSNPEFLREGSAVHDTFHGDRIVIGADDERAAAVVEEINRPFGIPIFKTDIRSAEMIKYASNAFLATKISFINEISNICEKLGANVEDVALGMGMDKRIGSQFLRAGIGYGGSCFPKDTQALVQIAGNVNHRFDLLESVIRVNNRQQALLVHKALERFGSLRGMKIALLGLAFKPNTDDMREAASIVVSNKLLEEGAEVVAYDPVAMDNARRVLDPRVRFADSVEEVLAGADAAFLLTEWPEFQELSFDVFVRLMKEPVLFDGRNCFSLEYVRNYPVEYHSVGRPSVWRKSPEPTALKS
jgi:UDPglucose 6-dehydrogenase